MTDAAADTFTAFAGAFIIGFMLAFTIYSTPATYCSPDDGEDLTWMIIVASDWT